MGSTISRFDYGYNANGQITTWRQQRGTTATNEFSLEYDRADQLTASGVAEPAGEQYGQAMGVWV